MSPNHTNTSWSAPIRPSTHLREGIATASRMKARDLEVYRVLHAMDRLDPESAGGAVRTMERDRRAGMEQLVRHLAESGERREDVPADARSRCCGC